MNPKRLLEHFNEITEAPDAVPRLRRFILDLAVRGKLVEQDPKDEPATDLLKRIEAARQQPKKECRSRNEKTLSPIRNDEMPFPLPETWKWVRLGDIFDYDAGTKTEPNRISDDAWLLELEDIEKDSGKIIQRFTAGNRSPKSTKSEFKQGDVLYGKLRPYLNKAVVADRPGFSTTEIVALRCFGDSVSDYTGLAIRRPDIVAYVTRLGQGTKMPRLRTEDAVCSLFPLPPLAEQHRIVAKVNELMILCDELESAQQKRERRRDRLVAATLNGIGRDEFGKDGIGRDGSPSRPNIPQLNTGAFGESALPKFFLNHLPRLTTRPNHIQQLRQTILNLAVYGKLVPQDPNEEPATDLLRKITAERLQLLQDKQRPVQKIVKPSSHLDDESRIPDSWQNCYLQDIAYQITDGTHLTPKYTDWGKPFLSAQNVKPFRFMPENHRYVSESDFQKYRANRKPERGDVLLTRVGAGIGESTVLDSDLEFAFYVSLCLIKIPAKLFLPHFLVIWLNSPIGRSNSTTRTYGKGFSQGNLNLGMIRTFRVPLPPLAEQHRIVVRVDEMMAVCDELEARLSTTTTIRRHLLEASLSEALAI